MRKGVSNATIFRRNLYNELSEDIKFMKLPNIRYMHPFMPNNTVRTETWLCKTKEI